MELSQITSIISSLGSASAALIVGYVALQYIRKRDEDNIKRDDRDHVESEKRDLNYEKLVNRIEVMFRDAQHDWKQVHVDTTVLLRETIETVATIKQEFVKTMSDLRHEIKAEIAVLKDRIDKLANDDEEEEEI